MAATGLRLRRSGGTVIESFRLLPHDAATNEPFQRPQFALILRRHKADRIADGIGATRAADAVDVIFRMHGEIVIHHMRDAVHVNSPRRNVRRHQHTHRAGFEILQRFQPLIL